MVDIETNAAQRFDGLGAVFGVDFGSPPGRPHFRRPARGRVLPHVRYRAEDGQSHGARHLVGIAHLGIGTLADHRSRHPDTEARQERRDDEEWGGPTGRARGPNRPLQNAHVGERADLGQAGFLISLLQIGEQLFGVRLVTGETDFGQRHRRRTPQVTSDRVAALRQLVRARREAVHEGPRQSGNHALSERVDLQGQAPHRGMRVGVAKPQGAELRLAIRQFFERSGQFG